jgi:hypothetical protein
MLCLGWLVASLSPRRTRFAPVSVHEGHVVHKVTMVQVLLRVLQFSPVNIIPPRLSMLMYHLGDEQQAPWWPQFRDIVTPSTRMTTPWHRVLLEKLMVTQLVNKFQTFYGTQRFITMFTRICHQSLLCARWIQSTSSNPILLRFI